ncbi:MAG: hypothetical protein ACT6RN_13745 [Agrobacterium sp.]|uniref:hypothetical protein n=1 Tax=Agrobacterium sp. TaxID=361 RepID=UPI004037693E
MRVWTATVAAHEAKGHFNSHDVTAAGFIEQPCRLIYCRNGAGRFSGNARPGTFCVV